MKILQASDEVRCRYLATVPLFQPLTDSERLQFAAQSRLRSYDRSEVLFRTGEPATELWCLVRGSVRIFRLTPEGKEKVIHLVDAPALIAEAPTLTGVSYPSDAECTSECLIVTIARRALLEVAQRSPELPWRLLAELFGRLRELTASLTTHGQLSSQTRVSSYLLGLAQQGDVVQLPAAKKDVASYLGLRAESFSRALAALQRQGAIAVSERRIAILDRALLEQTLADG